MPDRKSLDELAVELTEALDTHHNRRILHVKSGAYYRVVGMHYRESDMALCIEYSPIGEFWNQVKFARSVDEMDFGKRFILE